MAEIKLKLKERWVDIKTNKVIQSIVSEESIHIDDDLDQDAMKQHYLKERIGSTEHDGVRHEVSIVGDGLSKSEMFDFILNNTVTLTPSNGVWYKELPDGTKEKVINKYCVSINDCGMSGFDLEDAINYYVREIQK